MSVAEAERSPNLADPRAQRTRALLLSAFSQQVEQAQSLPSVAELVRTAGTSRSAFYCHFASIDDVARAVVREALDGLVTRGTAQRDEGASHREVARSGYVELLSRLAARRTLFVVLLSSTQGGAARRELRDALLQLALVWIEAAPHRPAGTDSQMTAAYLVGGILEVVAAWFDDDDPVAAPELAEALTTFLPSWFVTVDRRPSPAGKNRSQR